MNSHCAFATLRAAAVVTIVLVGSAATRADIIGFGTGAGWKLNNSPFFFSGDLFITSVGTGAANSAFYQVQQPMDHFLVHFTYTDAANGNNGQNGGNGAAFVIQNDPRGTSAVSSGGGDALGYGPFNPITHSAAVELNIDDIFTPPVGTALGINGSVGPYVTTGSLNLKSGDPIDVTLTYNGTTLTEHLSDTTAGTSYSRSFSVDLVGGVGSSAYVGFSGGAGLDTSTQVFSNFSFGSVPEPSSFVLAALGLIGIAAWRRFSRRVRS
jgi:hypothetical protein